jgi:O-antigen biosynthesis protein
MSLEPLQDLSAAADGYRVTGPQPEFRVRSDHPVLPSGWVAISSRWHRDAPPQPLTLLADTAGPHPESYLLPASTSATPLMLRLPPRVDGIRLRPPAGSACVALSSLQIVELSTRQVLSGLARPYVDAARREPGMAWHFGHRAIEVLRQHGARELYAVLTLRFTQSAERRYSAWVQRYDTPRARDAAAVRRQLATLRAEPLFSIITPVDREWPDDPTHVAASLRAQWYPHWELLLVETQPLDERQRTALRALVGTDARIHSVAAHGLARGEVLDRGLAQATGAFCGVIDCTARLAPHALFTLAVEHNRHPEAAMLYSDEDRIDAGGARHSPCFKPDWNPDLLCSQPYVGHLTVYRTAFVRTLGGWHGGADGVEEWDLALRAGVAIPPAHIRHVPHVLYHDTAADRPAPSAATTRRLLGDHFRRRGIAAELKAAPHGAVRIGYPVGHPPPLVSIIIPTRNGRDLLERCITSLREKTAYPHFELLIVDNQSDDDGARAYLRALQRQPGVRVLPFDAPFNFSALNNFAVQQAHGSVLAFLNNDVEVLSADWLMEMVGHAQRPEVGAVGAKLYYPDGRIQHAGVILGMGKLAGHAYRGVLEPEPGGAGRLFTVQTLSAVTAACMVLRADVFRAVGGFDDTLSVAYGDVDLCLRLRHHSYRIVWTPHAVLSHWESATRGLDHGVAKVRRLRREERVMVARWGAALDADPAYNPNLTLAAPGFAPAFPPRIARPWRAPRRNPAPAALE